MTTSSATWSWPASISTIRRCACACACAYWLIVGTVLTVKRLCAAQTYVQLCLGCDVWILWLDVQAMQTGARLLFWLFFYSFPNANIFLGVCSISHARYVCMYCILIDMGMQNTDVCLIFGLYFSCIIWGSWRDSGFLVNFATSMNFYGKYAQFKTESIYEYNTQQGWERIIGSSSISRKTLNSLGNAGAWDFAKCLINYSQFHSCRMTTIRSAVRYNIAVEYSITVLPVNRTSMLRRRARYSKNGFQKHLLLSHAVQAWKILNRMVRSSHA